MNAAVNKRKRSSLRGLCWAVLLIPALLCCGDACGQVGNASIEVQSQTYRELRDKGDLAGALVQAQKIEAAVKKAVGPNRHDYAMALAQLAEAYLNQGRAREAEPIAQQAVAILDKDPGSNQTDITLALSTLSVVYRRLDRLALAEASAKRTLALTEQAWGPRHPLVADALIWLEEILLAEGRFDEARSVGDRALTILGQAFGPNSRRLIDGIVKLASVEMKRGSHQEAAALLGRALAIKEKALGPDHPDVGQSLYDLANLYNNLGRYADAEPLYNRSLTITEKARGPDHPNVAAIFNSLGENYEAQGRYADAEALFKRSLAIREKALGPDDSDVGNSLNSLAALYKNEGRYADAEPLYKRSLTIREKALGPDDSDVGESLNNLAALYMNQARYVDAEALYNRSLTITEKALGPDHSQVAAILNNLAILYHDQGRTADAEMFYKRSLTISEKALGPDHPTVATLLYNQASLYDHQGRFADAELFYKRSLTIREKTLGPDHPAVAASLNRLGLLYRNQGRYADSLRTTQRVIAMGQAWPAAALPVLYGAQRENLIAAEPAMDASLDVVQRANETSAAAAVGKVAVRLAAGNDRLAQLVRKDQDLAGEAETLDKAIIAAVSKEPSKRDAAAEQRTRERLAIVAVERATLQKTFATEFPDYAALSNPLPMTTASLQSLLSNDEALVAFAAGGDETSYVFALTHDAFTWQAIPLGEQALSGKVKAFRRGLDTDMVADQKYLDHIGKKRELFDLAVANDLYTGLFGPVEVLIKDKKQLLVVPSGALTALPFHLLVTEKPAVAIPENLADYRNAAWLIKRQAVAVLPSIASLKALRAFAVKNHANKALVGFGDPIFNPAPGSVGGYRTTTKTAGRSLNTRSYTEYWKGAAIDRSELSESLPQLPDTAVELKSIAQQIGAPASDVHLGRDANETVVKHAPLSDYRIVYFATHALVAGDVKGLAEPSIVLSLPSQPSDLDDGLLTASEVAQLKLNADWVVLSACNTIAGDKPGAEALSGLARSFFYAGARALLVSHWAVDSEAATRLTTSTFAILKSDPKLGRAEALRQAMLGYLNDQSSPQLAYPAFWGPFAIIGEGAAH